MNEKWQASLAVLVFGLVVALGCVAFAANLDRTDTRGPRGKVTQKMWVQEFWQAGEKLYPARFCLELNHREEVCFRDENIWNSYGIGDWYGG